MTEQARNHHTRTRALRRAGGAAAAMAAAAGLCLAAAGASQAATTATPTCAAADLSVSVAQKLGGGMNHQGAVLRAENTGGTSCAVRGYPGLGLEDSAHHTLKSTTHWGDTWYADDPGKRTFTLRPGESAEAVASWTHASSNMTEAAYLQVTPPASTTYKTVKLPALVDNGEIDVTALAPHVELKG